MDIRTVSVAGAGVMGSGIAQVLAVAGYKVRLFDVREAVLAFAAEQIEHGRFGLRAATARGILTAEQADEAFARIVPTMQPGEAYGDADLIIEAVPEDLPLKLTVFHQLDELAPGHAILASNTSGFSIGALAASTHRPDRVIGWHWASPPPVIKVAEIIVHPGTSADTTDAIVAAALRCGKNAYVVKDQPLVWGFVANRLYMALVREADRVVAEGVATTEQVDAIMKDTYRWPAGPFELIGGGFTGWESTDQLGESARLALHFAPHVFSAAEAKKASDRERSSMGRSPSDADLGKEPE